MSRSACRSCGLPSITAPRSIWPAAAWPMPAVCARRCSLRSISSDVGAKRRRALPLGQRSIAADAAAIVMAAHRPRRRFSQNFLRDAAVIARVVDAIAPQPSARVIEIGPGHGALTAPLIARAGHITAIEIDRDLAEALRARFAVQQLTLTVADALTLDWPALAASDARPLTIAGNLPYHISTPLLFA